MDVNMNQDYEQKIRENDKHLNGYAPHTMRFG